MDKAMNETTSTYKVIFSGSILDGYTKSDVIEQFTKAFNLSDRQNSVIQQLFSGKIVTLKKGLSHQEAKRYRWILEKLGADCCIECEHSLMGGFEPDYSLDKERRRKAAKAAQTTDINTLSIIPK